MRRGGILGLWRSRLALFYALAVACAVPAAAQRAPAEAEIPILNAAECRYFASGHGSLVETYSNLVSIHARLDPVGRVFDSRTGELIDGARVTLIDAGTGEAAPAFGTDGVSVYPSTVVTGEDVRDAAGRLYAHGPGEYRFPGVLPGRYRLRVETPSGYRAPSQVPSSELGKLPGAPFKIVEPGSRGEVFSVSVITALGIDVPVDPVAASLGLQKTAERDVAAVGDLLSYTLRLENIGERTGTGLSLVDRLPPGFRYRSSSSRRDGEVAPDPEISADGRTLTFPVGDLPGGGLTVVQYVVEIGAGSRRGAAVNGAVALGDGGAESNRAQAVVRVAEELFGRCFLYGRVLAGPCDSTESARGLRGARLLLEDGTCVLTDEEGRYHLEGIPPGSHVIQLDPQSLPEGCRPLDCAEGAGGVGAGLSRLVSLSEGSLWRVDFRLARSPEVPWRGEAGLRMVGTPQGSRIDYDVILDVMTVPLTHRRVIVDLPPGATYEPGSSRLQGAALPDPEVVAGALVCRLEDAAAEQVDTLSFCVSVDSMATRDRLVSRAGLLFDTPAAANQRTPVAECAVSADSLEVRDPKADVVLRPRFEPFHADLSILDRAAIAKVARRIREAKIVAVQVTGHTDDTPIQPASRHIYPDNRALALARANSVAYYLRRLLEPHEVTIRVEGRGPDEPIASNRTAQGRRLNRRVELRLLTEERSIRMRLETGCSSARVVAPTASRADATAPVVADTPERAGPPALDDRWLATLAPRTAWIWPDSGAACPIPSIRVVIQHRPEASVVLLRNAHEVNRRNFEGTLRNRDGNVAVSVWTGVDLTEGDNRFEVVLQAPGEAGPLRLTRTVHYSGPPVAVELVPEKSRLVADGRTPPVVAVRLLDRDGRPAREKVIGSYWVQPPYASREEADAIRENPLGGMRTGGPNYVVGPDGIARIELDPTARSGEVVLRFKLEQREEELRAWLRPEVRDWVLVGLAEGTVGYRVASGHRESLEESDLDDDYYTDGKVAFFAQGRVKGEWLLTLACDSQGNLRGPLTTLEPTIDPDEYYLLYGDATQQGYDAPTSRGLFLRLERRQFYALFGDGDAGLTVTELSRYSRRINGLRSEYRGSLLGYSLFAAETASRFRREELRGDGTSGLYRLARTDLLLNSERVTLETRDRFRSEVVLSTKTLKRHLDYEIDYEAATLFFRFPVPSRDESGNPIHIVIAYEAPRAAETHLDAGGRGSVRPFGKALEVGATGVREGPSHATGQLAGVDAKLHFGRWTEWKAEGAWTDVKEAGAGQAFLSELRHDGGRLRGTAWFRRQTPKFGLGQQNSSEQGTEKFGADLDLRIARRGRHTGAANRQMNLASEAERDVAEVAFRHETGGYSLRSGFLHAEDRLPGRDPRRSDQVLGGATLRLFHGGLSLHAEHSQSLVSRNQVDDFPTRTEAGIDLRVRRGLSVFGRQEFTHGDHVDTDGTRAGLAAQPFSGNEVVSSLGRQAAPDGARIYAVFGLKQTWRLGERWFLDAGVDHSRALGKPDTLRVNPLAPPASGAQPDFVAASLGTSSFGPHWRWNARAEYFDSANETRWSFVPAVMVQPRRALGLAVGGRFALSDGIVDRGHADLRLGLSARPMNRPWALLQRLDLVYDEEKTSGPTHRGWRLVNNLHWNRSLGRRAQAALQFGAKYVGADRNRSLARVYTDLWRVELRRDLPRRFDVGWQGGVLHSWRPGLFRYNAGISVGYRWAETLWPQVGYNLAGFRDDDFSRGSFTSRGPFLRLSARLDSDLLAWLGLGHRAQAGSEP